MFVSITNSLRQTKRVAGLLKIDRSAPNNFLEAFLFLPQGICLSCPAELQQKGCLPI